EQVQIARHTARYCVAFDELNSRMGTQELLRHVERERLYTQWSRPSVERCARPENVCHRRDLRATEQHLDLCRPPDLFQNSHQLRVGMLADTEQLGKLVDD